jgi:aspartyl-tRNA(Asn)/glutamyl-tRNA(Gln) amidotransferase subunit A
MSECDWVDDPAAAVECRLARIAARDARVHAFVAVDAPGARQAAQDSAARRAAGRPLSPLDGMPVAIKANIAVAGWPFHAGIGAWRDRIAARDAACVARLREGGAVLLGLLNMDEAALGDTTENAFFGRTEHPALPGYTAGGSSGGAAAAVGAGFCVAALGTDTLGSVRIPAGYCGVVGHKPKPGAISGGGVVALAPAFDSVGFLAADAATAALVQGWLCPDTGDAIGGPDGEIGVFSLDGVAVAPETAAALARMAARAAQHGLAVRPMRPLDLPLRDIARAALLHVALTAAAAHADERARNPAGFSAKFTKLLGWAEGRTPAQREAAEHLLAQAATEIGQVCAPYAAVLMPTTPLPAFAFDVGRPGNTAEFTTLANVAGLAATAFPAGLQDGVLPLSVQVVGRDERFCLGLAGKLAEGKNVLF